MFLEASEQACFSPAETYSAIYSIGKQPYRRGSCPAVEKLCVRLKIGLYC